ncbi:MAG: peroxiredoxin [candidate division Zixibacteria bacterium]|nr:peroxiredoxin [candidate division Zixibacteria bacterium]
MTEHNPNQLPDNFPIPEDDGAADHLQGKGMPSILLSSTAGQAVNIAEISKTLTVFFFYPRTGVPGVEPTVGWDLIPGARGCTPQSCGFRDAYQDFSELQAQVFGVSAQPTSYQKEFADRSKLPFELLSDNDLELTDSLELPTFYAGGARLISRLSLVVKNGIIEKVFYPVFPPDKNAVDVLEYLKSR